MIPLKKLSIKTILLTFLLFFLIFLSFQENNFLFLYKPCLSISISALFETIIIFFKEKKWKLTESSLITGIIIGFVLASDTGWWLFVIAAITAISSKYIIRFNKKHIFNPAAFGVFFTILLFHGYTQWRGSYTLFLIIPAGIYFVYKIKKLEIVYSFFITYLILSLIQSIIDKTSFLDAILYANYFFIFIMLIEPKTSPFKKKRKILFGMGAAILSWLFYTFNFPYDADLPSLLILNIGNSLFIKKSSI